MFGGLFIVPTRFDLKVLSEFQKMFYQIILLYEK